MALCEMYKSQKKGHTYCSRGRSQIYCQQDATKPMWSMGKVAQVQNTDEQPLTHRLFMRGGCLVLYLHMD